MCVVLDADSLYEVFGENRTDAGEMFFKFINSGKTTLVVGGKLLKEAKKNNKFVEWLLEAQASNYASIVNAEEINLKVKHLKSSKSCKSNDHHIIALAQCANARLLYSNDRKLHQDFKNPDLINKPRGKVYSTDDSGAFRSSHKELLRRNACPRKTDE